MKANGDIYIYIQTSNRKVVNVVRYDVCKGFSHKPNLAQKVQAKK